MDKLKRGSSSHEKENLKQRKADALDKIRSDFSSKLFEEMELLDSELHPLLKLFMIIPKHYRMQWQVLFHLVEII